jgi:hypothetical protein
MEKQTSRRSIKDMGVLQKIKVGDGIPHFSFTDLFLRVLFSGFIYYGLMYL